MQIEGDATMTQKSKKYTKEFKDEALKMIDDISLSQRDIEDRLKLPRGTLGRWKRERTLSQAPDSLNQYKEFLALQKECKRLKMERDILKKAAAFFAKNAQ